MADPLIPKPPGKMIQNTDQVNKLQGKVKFSLHSDDMMLYV